MRIPADFRWAERAPRGFPNAIFTSGRRLPDGALTRSGAKLATSESER
jgi:hypothetical protein